MYFVTATCIVEKEAVTKGRIGASGVLNVWGEIKSKSSMGVIVVKSTLSGVHNWHHCSTTRAYRLQLKKYLPQFHTHGHRTLSNSEPSLRLSTFSTESPIHIASSTISTRFSAVRTRCSKTVTRISMIRSATLDMLSTARLWEDRCERDRQTDRQL